MLVKICLSVIATVVYLRLSTAAFKWAGLPLMDKGVVYTAREYILKACIWAPIWEEALFRFTIIGLGFWVDRVLDARAGVTQSSFWVFAVYSSIIFGWWHGDWKNIFVQGVAGLFFTILFRDEMLSGGKHAIWRAFVMLVVIHSLVNFVGLVFSHVFLREIWPIKAR